jgi:hypothetical protein
VDDATRSCLWEVAVGDISTVEFAGPGKWQKGGRFFGGGFGVVGAAEGMLIAAALNSLTTKTGVTTVVHLEAGADMSTWWHHAYWCLRCLKTVYPGGGNILAPRGLACPQRIP